MAAAYAVGIDLGTTNTVVAAARLEGEATAEIFPVAQRVTVSEIGTRPLLPSVLYSPLPGEIGSDALGDGLWVVGELSRRRGAEVPGRAIASSKSWLAHAGVDRTAAILPWGAQGDVPKLSPVDAGARLLAHVARAWDAQHPANLLADQDVVLTVPASFDEVARELSLECASRARLSPKLLEEPQAAFYDWMRRAADERHEGDLRDDAETLVLVVDVGGGTTDFSLLRVVGRGRVDRLAVGPHLLLGGDNMDLAIAHACEPRLVAEGQRLDAPRFAQLLAACRDAKETLLGPSAPHEAPVTLLAPGAALVGGARTTRLTKDEVERCVLDGFFPAIESDARPQRSRGALVAFGLPYERDVAITRHMAAFLARHLPPGKWPDAVLFNGGVFRATRVAGRVLESLSSWRGTERRVRRLSDGDPELAVARGAVSYAKARRGHGVRIGGGSAHGYFVGVASEGASGARAVCVVPRGAEEGVVHVAHGRAFSLALGRPARFELFASDRHGPRSGDVVDVDDERFVRLAPVATTLEGAEGGEVVVAVEGEITPVGTVDLACVEANAGAPRRFRLAFQLRAPGEVRAHRPSSLPAAPPKRLDAAFDTLDRVFGKPRADAGAREAKDLLRDLERVLGDRASWTTEISRGVFDALLTNARARRRSAEHERFFWLLAGFCVRPGYGDPLDPRRIALLSPLFQDRLAFPGEARGWQQFFIAWRRAAGGLDEVMQTTLRDFVDPHLAGGANLRRPKKPIMALDDALDMASTLERIAPARRSELGGLVLERTWTDRDPRLWVAVGRLGARVPAYASVHHVISPLVAERWLDHALREKWDAVPTAAFAALRLARRTGDRARDIGEGVRREVEDRLKAAGVPPEQVRTVGEVVAVEEGERASFFGEALPLGLRLVT